MSGAQGLQPCCVLACGKVPYRFRDGFPPVRRFQPLGTGPGKGYLPARPYKHKSFEFPRPSIEACLRKRKKEGLNLIFGAVRPGCTGSPLTENESFRAVSERVQSKK
jgi:hypothetical protein